MPAEMEMVTNDAFFVRPIHLERGELVKGGVKLPSRRKKESCKRNSVNIIHSSLAKRSTQWFTATTIDMRSYAVIVSSGLKVILGYP